jgi:ribonuclease BN (tRNA processing enzyme)
MYDFIPPTGKLPRVRFLLALLLSQLVSPAETARVVMIGSGTPIPDPRSSGPAVAVVINGQAYLFDAGPGIVRRAEEAAEVNRIAALQAPFLTRLFLTHLHSDHTLGYPDVILTPWVVGRREPLEVYGPKGTAAMTEHIKLAYAEDIDVRSNGLEHLPPIGLTINVHEIEKGPVYKDANVTVVAFPVVHGSWKHAFGYAIDAGGRSIVISGDTRPCQAIIDACKECDVLVHEVYSADRAAVVWPGGHSYHSSFHTSTNELAEIATKCKPKLLLLYHQLYFGSRDYVDLVKEVKRNYSGVVVSSEDLKVY